MICPLMVVVVKLLMLQEDSPRGAIIAMGEIDNVKFHRYRVDCRANFCMQPQTLTFSRLNTNLMKQFQQQ